tara:strand:+ start:997 stop:1101 length:105 start_codon:yes stop_codon:yes gene_type:complete
MEATTFKKLAAGRLQISAFTLLIIPLTETLPLQR